MIIGISGKMGSGKDTVGEFTQEFHPEFQIKKYADKLKYMVCLLLNCTREQLEDREFKEKELGPEWKVYKVSYEIDEFNTKNELFRTLEVAKHFMMTYSLAYKNVKIATEILTPRKILQLLGTECGRRIIHPDIWVNSTISEYTNEQNWIITDVRFPNEAAAIRERDGILIKIERPTDDLNATHESETALDNYEFDYIIENTGTLEQLKKMVESLTKIIIHE